MFLKVGHPYCSITQQLCYLCISLHPYNLSISNSVLSGNTQKKTQCCIFVNVTWCISMLDICQFSFQSITVIFGALLLSVLNATQHLYLLQKLSSQQFETLKSVLPSSSAKWTYSLLQHWSWNRNVLCTHTLESSPCGRIYIMAFSVVNTTRFCAIWILFEDISKSAFSDLRNLCFFLTFVDQTYFFIQH